MLLPRRGFLRTMLQAPTVIRSGVLMPVKVLKDPFDLFGPNEPMFDDAVPIFHQVKLSHPIEFIRLNLIRNADGVTFSEVMESL